jgi:hypothetical protein
MAGCGCGGGSGGWQGGDLVPADQTDFGGDDYTWPPRSARVGEATSTNAGGALVAPDGVRVWDPESGKTITEAGE